MRGSRWFALLAVLGAMGLFSVGCPGCDKQPPVEDAGVDAGPEDAGVDAGPVDAGPDLTCQTDQECSDKIGPDYVCDEVAQSLTYGTCVQKCRIDDDCQSYDLGLRCDEANGHCIPATGCNDDTNCNVFSPGDYCHSADIGCRCVTETNSTGLDGVCRRRHGVCDECTDDSQCGVGPTFDPNGRCRALQGDPDGQLPDGGVRKYCFQQPAGAQCGCGMVIDVASGTCIPQSGSCGEVGCSADKDCPFNSVCNVQACLCEPRCVWNFDPARQELNPPGCRPGTSCWVDPANLDPNSPFFGAGRCRPPCGDDATCIAEDSRLVCKAEKVAGGESAKRCRPGGQCMDDFECPEQPMGSLYLGYCDRANFTCRTDCRTGVDPKTGSPYDDCISGYKCATENGVNVCKQQTCVELGGARIACTQGQYCCGEDRNGDGNAEQCPTTGLEPNNCYTAESPPFCTTCMSHADCRPPNAPNVNGSPLPSFCIGGGKRPDGSDGVNICAPASFNDYTQDAFGVPRAFKGCPKSYQPVPLKVDCTSKADCGPNGLCDGDPEEQLPDGGRPLRCLCITDGKATQTSGCPGDADAGTLTYCKFGVPGKLTTCLQSIVCVPPPGAAYADPAMGGCGL